MSGLLDTQLVVLEGETVAFALPVTAPSRKCFLDAGIATARGGPFLHASLARTIVVTDGRVPGLALYTRDLRALFPRGGRAWLVIRYGAQLLATGEVQLVVP